MDLITKGDLVNAALRRLGIASDATLTDAEPQSVDDAVNDLEMMMAEWAGAGAGNTGIRVGYLFSEAGTAVDPGDPHGLPDHALSAVFHNLALRIAPDYEIEPSVKIINVASYGKEQLVKASALANARRRRGGYPDRMPIGSGNRLAVLNGVNYYPGRKPDGDDTTTPD